MVRKYPDLKWEHILKKTRDVDYGHVIIKLKKLKFNPIWVVNVIFIKIALREEGSIHEVFKIWERHVNVVYRVG